MQPTVYVGTHLGLHGAQGPGEADENMLMMPCSVMKFFVSDPESLPSSANSETVSD